MNKRGYTIIEAVVATAIFLIIAGALFGIIQIIFEGIGQTRVRHTARLLANEKIEEARNLSYDNLGTQGGIPSGPISASEQIELTGMVFTVDTSIIYIDDAFDGTAPEDTLSTDYKRVRVEVSWGGGFESRNRPVVLVTDIAPQGVETMAGGGTLSILVFNAGGEPVSGATVEIINLQTNPQIDLTTTTDSFGRVILPGSPSSVEGYKITVSKEGYSTDRTYSSEEVANPIKPYVTVIEGGVTEVSFAIDKVSSLTIRTYGSRDSGFPMLANVEFNLRGEKIIGTDTDENEVYKYDEDLQTDSSGAITLSSVEWDNYYITLTEETSRLAGSNPYLPIALLPDTNINLALSLASSSQNSLLVLATDSEDNPLASASSQLVNSGLGYDESILTGDPEDPDFGQSFFGNLSNYQYDLTVSFAGYEEATASVQISGETFEKVILNEL